MVTQTKEGNCYKHITSRQAVAESTEEDEDGMDMKEKLSYKANMPITTNKCTTKKGRTTRTYLEKSYAKIHASKGRTTRTYSYRQRKV